MTKQLKPFNELTLQELYAVLQLRMEVFVVEQHCPYLDCDDKDIHAHHLLFWQDGELAAYCRLLPQGISYENYCSIGRVVTKPSHRGKGLGIELMRDAIHQCKILFNRPIKISAQSYLEKFYTELGFEVCTEEYLEDDIPHKGMKMD